jgi:hypothetical protein
MLRLQFFFSLSLHILAALFHYFATFSTPLKNLYKKNQSASFVGEMREKMWLCDETLQNMSAALLVSYFRSMDKCLAVCICDQGCQIFRGTTYLDGKNILNVHKIY